MQQFHQQDMVCFNGGCKWDWPMFIIIKEMKRMCTMLALEMKSWNFLLYFTSIKDWSGWYCSDLHNLVVGRWSNSKTKTWFILKWRCKCIDQCFSFVGKWRGYVLSWPWLCHKNAWSCKGHQFTSYCFCK